MYYINDTRPDRGPKYAVMNSETQESVGYFWKSEDADEVCKFYNEQEKTRPKTTTVFKDWIERQCGTQDWDHPESVLGNFMCCAGASSLDVLSVFEAMSACEDIDLNPEQTQKLKAALKTNSKYHVKLSSPQ